MRQGGTVSVLTGPILSLVTIHYLYCHVWSLVGTVLD